MRIETDLLTAFRDSLDESRGESRGARSSGLPALDENQGANQIPPEALRHGLLVSPAEVAATRRSLAAQLGLSPEELEYAGRPGAFVDPDVVARVYDLSRAVTFGARVNPDDEPKGTWIYYAPDRTYVRRPGEDYISRIEATK